MLMARLISRRKVSGLASSTSASCSRVRVTCPAIFGPAEA
jgi:hypothetical protein